MAVRYLTPEPWGHNVSTEPAAEPVTAANGLRAWLRYDHTTEDTVIDALAVGARKMVENVTKRKTVTQTVTVTTDRFPAGNWELPFPPVIAVTEVAYRDSAGAAQTVAVPTLHNASQPNLAAILEEPTTGWPSVDGEPAAVTITMTCGYGTASTNVPSNQLTAIKMLAAHWKNYPEAATENAPETIPLHVESLLTNERWWTQ